MNSNFERDLEKYAEVIVKVGLNIQPGQRLLIGMPFYELFGTPLELAPLVRLVAKHAYGAGARFVEVLWHDEQIERIRHQHAPRDSFEEFPTWRTDAALDIAQAGDALLIFASRTPELLEVSAPLLGALGRDDLHDAVGSRIARIRGRWNGPGRCRTTRSRRAGEGPRRGTCGRGASCGRRPC